MDSVLSLIGLAKKAGRIQAGEEPTAAAARAGQARLILLADDAAENTVRRAERFCEIGRAPLLVLAASKAALGGSLGRSVCAVAAVTDAGFAASIAARVAEGDETAVALAETLAQKAKKGYGRRQEALAHERNRKDGKRRFGTASKADGGVQY